MRARALSILGASCGSVLVAIAALWATGDLGWTPPPAQRPEPSSMQAAKVVMRRADLASLPQSLERPLFAQTRRPVPVVAEGPAAQPEPDPLRDVVLLGVLDGGGEDKTAIVRAEGSVRRIKVGEALGPWSLQSLEERAVVFQRGGEQKRLLLKYLPQPAPRPVAAAALGAGHAREGDKAPGEAPAPDGKPASAAPPAAPAPVARPAGTGSGRPSLAQRIAERRARLGLDKK